MINRKKSSSIIEGAILIPLGAGMNYIAYEGVKSTYQHGASIEDLIAVDIACGLLAVVGLSLIIFCGNKIYSSFRR